MNIRPISGTRNTRVSPFRDVVAIEATRERRKARDEKGIDWMNCNYEQFITHLVKREGELGINHEYRDDNA